MLESLYYVLWLESKTRQGDESRVESSNASNVAGRCLTQGNLGFRVFQSSAPYPRIDGSTLIRVHALLHGLRETSRAVLRTPMKRVDASRYFGSTARLPCTVSRVRLQYGSARLILTSRLPSLFASDPPSDNLAVDIREPNLMVADAKE
jgi:hypothetical protein